MDLLNKLTLKNLKLNKKRTIVTIIGIMLSVALITAVASIYTSGIKSLIRFETYEKGNYHVAYYNVPVQDLKIFQHNQAIETLSLTKNIGYAKINSQNAYKPYAYLKAFTKTSLENLAIRLTEGRLPENNQEIVIPTHLQTNGRLNLKVGDKITLDVGTRISVEDNANLKQNNPFQKGEDNMPLEDIINTTSKTYEIVGIIERPDSSIEGYSAPGYTFITLLDDTNLTDQIDIYAKYNKDNLKNIYKINAGILNVDETLFEKYYTGTSTYEETVKYLNEIRGHEKYNININTYLIDLQTDPLGLSSTGGLAIVVLIVMAIIIFTSVFCIKNSFDISITEKIKQYGMLKSIGATKKQIKKNVFYEATILGLIGIPLGIICGLFASYILIIVSNYFLKSSMAIGMSLYFSFSIIAIVVAIVLGIITIYLSALKSANRASKISPIDSIRNSANIKITAKSLKSPQIISKIFGMGGEISYKNLKRNKKKYRTTVISIVVSVAVFIALASFMNMAFDNVQNEVKTTEYNLELHTSNINNIDTYNKYVATTNLADITDYTILRTTDLLIKNFQYNPKYQEFMNNEETEESSYYLSIYALGDTQYQKYIKELGLNYNEVKDKGILMDYIKVGRKKANSSKWEYKTLHMTNYKKHDIISGSINKDCEIEVSYVTDVKPFGLNNTEFTYLIVSDELFNQITDNVYSKYLNILYKSEKPNQLQDNIDELLKGEDYSLNNLVENVKMINNLYTLVAIFLYGFIIVISLIGITNIFNTITTNMELRKPEFAMLKSIGMTTKEFNKMIRLETFFMGMKALLFGLPIGLALSYTIYYFLRENGLPYRLPLLAIGISIGAVFILISLIMKYSMSKINHQNTIETIRNENI